MFIEDRPVTAATVASRYFSAWRQWCIPKVISLTKASLIQHIPRKGAHNTMIAFHLRPIFGMSLPHCWSLWCAGEHRHCSDNVFCQNWSLCHMIWRSFYCSDVWGRRRLSLKKLQFRTGAVSFCLSSWAWEQNQARMIFFHLSLLLILIRKSHHPTR